MFSLILSFPIQAGLLLCSACRHLPAGRTAAGALTLLHKLQTCESMGPMSHHWVALLYMPLFMGWFEIGVLHHAQVQNGPAHGFARRMSSAACRCSRPQGSAPLKSHGLHPLCRVQWTLQASCVGRHPSDISSY